MPNPAIIPLFATPDDWDALADWINRHPSSDRPHLWTAAGMAWNLATTLAVPDTPDTPREAHK